MSVTKNVTLGREPRRFGLVNWRAAREKARARLARLGLDINVDASLGTYSVAIQQLIAIARALEDDTRVLVLDEPTASLDANETKMLFDIVRDLKAQGIAIVFISHFLDQVYEIADRITVLRNGRLVGSGTVAEMPRMRLVSLMLGRELQSVEQHRITTGTRTFDTAPIMVAAGLGKRRSIAPFDLSLHAGEVIGLAGLLGSGRTETAKVIFGVSRPDSGQLTVDGVTVSVHSARQSIRRGIAFCPEDRKAEGLFLDLSVRENIMMALQSKRGWLRQLGFDEQEKLAQEMIKALAIATPDADKPVGQLSGGNQQKVVLARALVSRPRILVLDEPTRGIDVGAKREIYDMLRALADGGVGILMISSDMEEVIGVSDRIAVMHEGRISGTLEREHFSEHRVLELAVGHDGG
jgi:simple sugar transport system ATP-binding protein